MAFDAIPGFSVPPLSGRLGVVADPEARFQLARD
jgi:hypothetical protein